jgi:hypothetical protein
MTTIADVPLHAARRTINWSPYLVGAGIGALSWIAFAVFGDPIGVTTAYSRIASLFAIPLIGVRLPDLTGVPGAVWLAALAAGAVAFFWWIESQERSEA